MSFKQNSCLSIPHSIEPGKKNKGTSALGALCLFLYFSLFSEKFSKKCWPSGSSSWVRTETRERMATASLEKNGHQEVYVPHQSQLVQGNSIWEAEF